MKSRIKVRKKIKTNHSHHLHLCSWAQASSPCLFVLTPSPSAVEQSIPPKKHIRFLIRFKYCRVNCPLNFYVPHPSPPSPSFQICPIPSIFSHWLPLFSPLPLSAFVLPLPLGVFSLWKFSLSCSCFWRMRCLGCVLLWCQQLVISVFAFDGGQEGN